MASNVGDELVLNIEDNFGYRDKTIRQIKVQIINVSYDEYDSSPMYLCYVPNYLTQQRSGLVSKQSWCSTLHQSRAELKRLEANSARAARTLSLVHLRATTSFAAEHARKIPGVNFEKRWARRLMLARASGAGVVFEA